MNGSLSDSTAHHVPGAEDLIELLRTLADPIRLRLLRLLESHSAGLSVGELAEILKLPQSTVSRHLKTLADAHLADSRRDGTSTFYKIAETNGTNGNGNGGASKQLRQLAKTHLEHDPLARTDSQRLAAVLRKRQPAADAFFGKHAPQWDHLRAQWFGETFHLEALLALLNPDWILADIGTGTGAMLPLLAPHVQKIIAVDPTPAMLKAAKSRVKELNLTNVDLRQGAIGGPESLPIDKASVDVALLALVLAYTVDPLAALKEIRRILKPGGILLIIDLQPHTVELFKKELNHRWMGFAQPQLQTWLKEAGFTTSRWHPLHSKTSRSKDSGTQIPDLFALRAQVPHA